MTLVMTLLVRNSEDIIATNIDYHLRRGVDFVIATDNLSDDGTRGILEHYRRQGVLHLILENEDNYAQHQWVTRMARLAHSDFGADWVINSDDDEFWWPEAGSLKETLQAIPEDVDAIRVPRHNFLPRPEILGTTFVETMIVREAQSRNALGSLLPPKVCHRAFDDVLIAQGNHNVRRNGHLVPAAAAALGILHFPLRTYRQFSRKIALGGAAVERNAELKHTHQTWRLLYDKLKCGELETYYNSQVLDDAAVELGLKEGRVVLDERLKSFVQQQGIPCSTSR